MRKRSSIFAAVSSLVLLFAITMPPPPAAAGVSIIDCPGDTTTYRGGRIDLCPLNFTNPESSRQIMSYFMTDSGGWLTSPFCAGHTRGMLQTWADFDICDAWHGLAIEAPPDAVHGEWTDVRIVVRSFHNNVPKPVLAIEADGLGPWTFQGLEAQPGGLDVPGGTPLDFTWYGDSSDHGAETMGYRYGWDITDPMDDSEWACRFEPGAVSSSRTWHAGMHVLTVEVVDDSGAFTRGSLVVTVVPGSEQIQALATPVRASSTGGRDIVRCAGECTFRVTIDNSVGARRSTWGGIKKIYGSGD